MKIYDRWPISKRVARNEGSLLMKIFILQVKETTDILNEMLDEHFKEVIFVSNCRERPVEW